MTQNGQNTRTKPSRKKKKTLKITGPCFVSTGLLLIAEAALMILLSATQLIPSVYLVLGGILSLVFCAVVFALTIQPKRGKMIGGAVLAGILIVISLVADYYVGRTLSAVRAVANAEVERATVTFYTLEDNSAQTLEDLAEGSFGILAQLDRTNTDATLQQVEQQHQLTLTTVEYANLTQLADALLNGEVDAIVLNEAYLPLYEDTPGYEDFASRLRQLSTQVVEHVVETQPETDNSDPIVNILISGSDTRNSTIDSRGRSDVNILVSMNTQTHEILLLSTPRDYFVPLDVGVDNAYDKLTHAGIYGMDVLMGTLENLYGVQIDYYFRINFTGFVDVIDALGGIQVYSDYTFDARGAHFEQGWNTVNGEEALKFARERYAFKEGDRQRGDNQMEVIKGVLNKAMNPSVLASYPAILDSIQDCIDTSVPYDVLAALVRQQLSDNAQWTVESFSVNGSDAHSTTYSMNQELYVMIPDESTVEEAKTKLAAIGNTVEGQASAEQQPAA